MLSFDSSEACVPSNDGYDAATAACVLAATFPTPVLPWSSAMIVTRAPATRRNDVLAGLCRRGWFARRGRQRKAGSRERKQAAFVPDGGNAPRSCEWRDVREKNWRTRRASPADRIALERGGRRRRSPPPGRLALLFPLAVTHSGVARLFTIPFTTCSLLLTTLSRYFTPATNLSRLFSRRPSSRARKRCARLPDASRSTRG